jgi:uncharacterized membrane protein YkoI
MTRTTVMALALILAAHQVLARPVGGDLTSSAQRSGLAAMQEDDEREPGPADLEEAIEIALKRFPGEATRSETVVIEGRSVHEIRIFGNDGTVRTVRVDPDTGAIISPRQE